MLSAAACLALFKFQAGPIKVIAACAISGLVLSYWH
jgi:chromate transporter